MSSLHNKIKRYLKKLKTNEKYDNKNKNRKRLEKRMGNDKFDDNFVVGKNSVEELLKSESEVNFIIASCKIPSKILELSKNRKIIIKKCDQRKLDRMFKDLNHQGIAAQISPRKYCSVEHILELSKIKNEKTFILILDKIQDPHNFGAIIRTAECMGVHGIIIGKRNCVQINSTVEKCSCGAIEYSNIARVDNLSNTVKKLKEKGVWIIGTDADGKDIKKFEGLLKENIAIIIGSEGRGISELLRKNCDEILSIPMKGKINSLNASVASAIFMMKVLESRR